MRRLTDWLFKVCRYLLYLWVRTDVLGQKVLEKAGTAPIVYALPHQSFSDRLVLEQECLKNGLPSPRAGLAFGSGGLRRRFFFLTEKQGRWFGARQLPKLTGRIGELIRAASEDPNFDVQIVPVSIFWGRAPHKEQSLLKLLLSDNWQSGGSFSQFFTILLHGRNTFVQFSRPLSLRALMAESRSPEIASRKLARILRVHFRLVRQTVVGPDLSHRRTLVSSLIRTPAVREAIEHTAKRKNIPIEKARREALSYADEIASNVAISAVRFLNIILTWVWNKIYNGVTVNHAEAVKEASREGGLIYVPCHRSHIDYLLLSYVLYQNGLMVPHIAAGINLNMPVVGPLLRRGGAFFMRRTFRNNKLYAAVFNEYMHSMLTHGHPVEYFVEGGRSRTGRTLMPKAGMLNMTVRSHLRDHKRPILFVPVYIGYEKILEERSYLGELRGKQKEKESIFSLVKTVRSLKNHGRVVVNFGQPLRLDHMLDAWHPTWREESGTRDEWPVWLTPVVSRLAERVACSINEAAAINPVNITGTILLTTNRLAMDARLLAERAEAMCKLLRARPYTDRVTFPEGSGQSWVEYIEQMGLAHRQQQKLGDIITLEDSDAVLLTYYRNNILHLMALPALIACLFQNRNSLGLDKARWLIESIYPYIRSELFLRWSEEELWPEVEAWMALFEAHGLLRRSGDTIYRPAIGSEPFVLLMILAQTILPTIERYYIVVGLLRRQGSGTVDSAGLEAMSVQMAERMSILYGLNAPEFFDRNLFRNFIHQLEKRDIVNRDESGRLIWGSVLEAISDEARFILNSDRRQSILQVANESPALAESLDDSKGGTPPPPAAV